MSVLAVQYLFALLFLYQLPGWIIFTKCQNLSTPFAPEEPKCHRWWMVKVETRVGIYKKSIYNTDDAKASDYIFLLIHGDKPNTPWHIFITFLCGVVIFIVIFTLHAIFNNPSLSLVNSQLLPYSIHNAVILVQNGTIYNTYSTLFANLWVAIIRWKYNLHRNSIVL